jgi:hypothetical protein
MCYNLFPITFKEACLFIEQYHRHLKPPQGHKFSIAATNDKNVISGVIIVGRPVSRILDDKLTLEITRCCVVDNNKNLNSFLYAAAWRVTKNLGYSRLITYIRKNESGSTLKALNWRLLHITKSHSWSCKSRPRLYSEDKEDKLCFSSV